MFRAIIKRADGVRGQRPVELSKNRDLLINLELNAAKEFTAVCPVKYTAQHNEARVSGTITVQQFVPMEMISIPGGATHFRLLQLFGTVPDVVYNVSSKRYESADPFFEGLNDIKFSDYVALKSAEPVTITLDAVLQGAPVVGANVSIIQGLGIMFFEQIGSVYYPLGQGNAMKLVDVF